MGPRLSFHVPGLATTVLYKLLPSHFGDNNNFLLKMQGLYGLCANIADMHIRMLKDTS